MSVSSKAASNLGKPITADINQDDVGDLEKHRLNCHGNGNYLEAETARAKLKNLCDGEQDRRRDDLKNQQLHERMGVEEAHKKELEDFNITWDKKVSEFEAHAVNLQETLAERAKQEHGELMEKLRKETEPRTPRWSSSLLQMRQIQSTLAKQKKYPEAAERKDQADKIEKQEYNAWDTKRNRKIANVEAQFMQKQQLEMAGLLKRIESGRSEQVKARKIELNRLLQRYQNVKVQLDSQQRIIMQRLDKFPVSAMDIAKNKGGKVSAPSSPQSSPRAIGA